MSQSIRPNKSLPPQNDTISGFHKRFRAFGVRIAKFWAKIDFPATVDGRGLATGCWDEVGHHELVRRSMRPLAVWETGALCAPDDMIWIIWINHRVASCWYGKEKREWKTNERVGQVRIRPVGHVWGIGSLVHTL
ncbi:hypothetical protein JCGZ_02932 [Jatropha curcas]|uniref:Uncharacterized protein n=1 Tax=Jatropha curcas TaxID=180498 RepID=A0A067L1C3_JATCU|nr:hypothetical protein JCGZ_02932 [Jatropha curcas]